MLNIALQVANRLKSVRKALRLTQFQLAKKSKISLRHLQNIEAGMVDLRISTLGKIADSLNISTYQLLFKNDVTSSELDCCVTPYCFLDELDVAIQICNAHGLIIYVNAKACEFHGATRDLIAKKCHIWDFCLTEKEKQDLENYLKYLCDQQPTPTPYITKNKTFKHEIIDISVHWNYLRCKNGQVKGFVSTLS